MSALLQEPKDREALTSPVFLLSNVNPGINLAEPLHGTEVVFVWLDLRSSILDTEQTTKYTLL